jgi:hypothetical protein
MEKIRAVTAPAALVAAGGLCAPLTPIYDLPILSDADRPVWGDLPKFQADRGGITFPTPIGLTTSRDAITRVTAAQDEAGGSSAVKACLTIDCDDFQSATVDAIAGCVEFSNMGARAWPERVANIGELVQVAHAEEGELGLLTRSRPGRRTRPARRSTARPRRCSATCCSPPRATATGTACAPTVSCGHCSRPTQSTCSSPTSCRASSTGSAATRPESSSCSAATGSRRRSTWTAPTSRTSQAAAALNDWPSTVVWFLYAEGTWIGLDMGRIDLGIVRDSELNSRNVYRTFFETFEGIAKTGVESIQVTSTVCPNGTVAAASTAITC